MNVEDIGKVVKAWQKEYIELGGNALINYVQIFENKGAVMGCSNPHPHGQIWSQSTLPNEVDKKDQQQSAYFNKNNSSLLGNYIAQELKANERIIYQNDDFVVLTPFWAVWPFEAMIVPKKHHTSITKILEQERLGFADAISKITKAYDKLFECSFPYSSGIHQSPTNGKSNEHWHWHMSILSTIIKKRNS